MRPSLRPSTTSGPASGPACAPALATFRCADRVVVERVLGMSAAVKSAADMSAAMAKADHSVHGLVEKAVRCSWMGAASRVVGS